MIPSLLQIPSAVSDSKLHSVLPNNGKGDFTFDRSTGATRINKDGLIEEVGYFSSELVQNGNFSELGSELVTDGDFSSNTNWSLNDWFINNGKATLPITSTNNLNQSISITQNKTYKIVFTISNLSDGGIRIRLGTGSMSSTITTNGTHTLYMQHTTTNHVLRIYANTSGVFNGEIDNVSVKQVDPNDRWTLDTGWSYGSNKVTGSATTSEIEQDVDLPSGKVYKTTFTIEDYVSGDVRIRFRGGTTVNGTNRSGNGTYTEILTSTGHTNVKIDGGTSFTGSVTNISVVEVQGDRPRLSYDITNGVVEDKPHLLLEPSSTNLHIFSTQSSQWTKSNWTTTDNYAISPDGTKNAFRAVSSTNNALLYISGAGSSGTNTVSVYAKSNTGTNQKFRFFANGTNTISSDFTVTNEWTRFEYSYTYSAVTAGIYGASSELSDILFFGFQHEVNPYATSYIPTAGTTITRAAETCNNSKPSVNSTEGVLFVDYASLSNSGNYRLICLSDGTTTNRVFIGFRLDTGYIYYFVIVGGSTVASHITSTTSLDFSKVAVKWKANDFALWIDGSEISTDTSGSSFSANTLNTLQMNEGDGAGFEFYGKVKGLAVYNEALSESQLMQLTGVTASSIYSNFVTRTASFTVEALNEVKKVIDNL